jgi:hypothetical protein
MYPNDCPQCTRVMTFSDTGIHYQYVKNYIEMRASTPITITDPAGDLLFYTNGNLIATYTHEIMENGNALNAGSYFSHVHLITGDSIDSWSYPSLCYMVLPDPDEGHVFYLLHTFIKFAFETDSIPDAFHGYSERLQMTKIDMSANNGKGKVVYKNKTVYSGLTGYRFNAVRHGNGRGWWLLLGGFQGDTYLSMHLEKDSIIEMRESKVPVVQPLPLSKIDSMQITANPIFVSPDGQWVLDNGGRGGFLRRSKFDRCSGLVSFVDTLYVGMAEYDPADFGSNFPKKYEGFRVIGFSPDSRFLYLFGIDGMYQYELRSDSLLQTGVKLSGPPIVMEDITQLPEYHLAESPVITQGPDGKLYALFQGSHHVIHRPNEKGQAADMCLAYEQPPSCLGVPHSLFSPWYPNYRLGPLKDSDCDTIISSATTEEAVSYGLRIWPNPASGMVYLDITLPEYTATNTRLAVYDLWGREVHTHYFPEYAYLHSLDTAALPAGLYIVRLCQGARPVATERLVVTD